MLALRPSATIATTHCSTLRRLGMRKCKILAHIVEVHIQGIISVSQTLASSHKQKSAKFLNLKYLVLITYNLLMITYWLFSYLLSSFSELRGQSQA